MNTYYPAYKHIVFRLFAVLLTIEYCMSGSIADVYGKGKYSQTTGTLLVSDLRIENKIAPIGIDVSFPRFSWVMNAINDMDRGQMQTAWHVQVASDLKLLSENKPDIWNSGKVEGRAGNNIAYSGKKLQSGKKYYWRVKVWDKHDIPSAWSEPSYWKMGLLSPEDWQGEWIKDTKPVPAVDSLLYRDLPAPIFRKRFSVDKKIKSATLYVRGLGYYEAYLNGHRVGDYMLDPGWTDYSKRVFYSTYDVASLLEQNDNFIGIMLGNGWYNPLPMRMWGRLNIREYLTIGQPAFILQLNIQYEDGSEATVFSDKDWKATDGPIVRNNVYLGEHYDNRKALPGWSTAQFKAKDWRQVEIADHPGGKLQSQPQPPIVMKDTLVPAEIRKLESGKYIVDFGRNFAGVINLRVKAKKGTVIKIRYGELLYPDGSLNVMTSTAGQIKRPDGGGTGAPDTAYQEDVFITSGKGVEVFQPRFTYHGFRYAEVSGYPSVLDNDDILGLVMHADVPKGGLFYCSDPLINKIQEACRNTFLSNLFSVQSDCPHREKFGYGGDILATSEAFMNNFDMSGFYAKTVTDFADAARSDGGLTETAPFIGIADAGLGNGSGPIEWGSVHPVLIYRLYQYYGNHRLLKEQYPVAKKWMDFLRSKAKDNIIDITLGDHESIDPKDKAVSGTSFYYYNAFLLSWMAKMLGYKEDAKKYESLAEQIKKSFNEKLVNSETGRVGLGTQATQAHALYFNLLPVPVAQKAFKLLEEQVIDEHQGHISTGMFGTKFITEVLSLYGNADLAYEMVTKEGFPGWAHMLDNGATTIWEHWALSDNTFSHNHPMFGVVSEWFYRYLGGIRPAENAVGFNKIIIQPQITKLSYAKAEYQSILGKISISWKVTNGKLYLDVVIPVNANAEIYIPAKDHVAISEGSRPVAVAEGIQIISMENSSVRLNAGSGHYSFVVDMSK